MFFHNSPGEVYFGGGLELGGGFKGHRQDIHLGEMAERLVEG